MMVLIARFVILVSTTPDFNMSRFFNADEIDEAEREERKGYRQAQDHYAGFPCPNCKRSRMVLRVNGKMICEKCHWDSDRKDYDSRAVHFFS